MSRKILLHIGSPKCGSTFLQRVLLQNTDALASARVLYPHTGQEHPGNAGTIENLTQVDVTAWFDAADTVVLSHEDLFAQYRRGAALAEIAKTLDIEVQLLVFLRPFSEFVFGDYSQFMKQKFKTYLKDRNPYEGRSFEQFAQDRCARLAPHDYLRAWQKVFPASRLTLESHLNIRKTLESILSGLEMDWEIAQHRTNPSLRTEDCDRLATALKDRSMRDEEIRAMMQSALMTAAGKRWFTKSDRGRTAHRIAWLETLFEPQNKALMEFFDFDNRAAQG